jgi:hypothetical protein
MSSTEETLDVPQRRPQSGKAKPKQKSAARRQPPVHATRAQEEVRPPVHGEDEDRPWTPPANLEAPPPRPGYVQRWIRVSIRAEDDVTNVSQSFQEGWEPRRADTVPPGFNVPTISHGKYSGIVGVHGLILCEMPAKRNAERNAYYRNIATQQTQAVATDLATIAHPDMPITQNRKSEVKFGKRTPNVAPDNRDALSDES